jgi:hypothetical protein
VLGGVQIVAIFEHVGDSTGVGPVGPELLKHRSPFELNYYCFC